jgi:L-threonylcarbamoyladenylate synthase
MVKLDLSEAIEALRCGNIIVYPTDTLYGLGADIYNNEAVKRIFKIKKRPTNMPLSVAVSDFYELKKIAFTNDKIRHIVNTFLPGKLTLILKKKSCVSDIVTGGFKKVAVRIPDCSDTLSLLSEFGPITATSANIHGLKTPDIINDIKMQFKNDDISVYLDKGKLKGKPSSIIDMTEKQIKILREGAINKRAILDEI